MYVWVIYDISKDKARLKVAKYCKRKGLKRVQKSVFLGRLKRKQLQRLENELKQLVNWRTDAVFVVPMSKEEYRVFVQIGKTFDKQMLEKLMVGFF